jgi:hypothetical protein
MNSDLEHLRLLSIFHYVVGGLAAMFALFPIFHLAMGIGMVAGRFPDPSEQRDMQLFGWLFVAMAAIWIVAALTFAVCVVLAGRFLARRTHYTFCFIIAALSCAFMPFGTILGVFTIVVLVRPSVRQLFEAAPAA